MSFDGLMLKAIVNEIASILPAKVEKIHQPDNLELVFLLQARGSKRLSISAHPRFARIHLTEQKSINPPTPPMFTMVLRKHLQGAILHSISQHELERICYLDFQGYDELGMTTSHRLVVELMGKHSNIILLDNEGKILDAIKRIPPYLSRIRTVLPSQEYILPPAQGKINLLKETIIPENQAGTMRETLFKNIEGLSPQSSSEILLSLNYDPDLPWNEQNQEEVILKVQEYIKAIANNQTTPSLRPGKIAFAPFMLKGMDIKEYSSPSKLLDIVYTEKENTNKLEEKRKQLDDILKNHLDKLARKKDIHEQSLAEAKNAEKYKLFGELLTANLYQLKQGEEKAILQNYYNQETVEIPLDTQKSPADNAQRYFKQYNKAKRTKETQSALLVETISELNYLDTVSQAIADAETLDDLAEIHEELIKEGYAKAKQQKKKEDPKKPEPRKYVSPQGFTIYVGKNNNQNDYLTMKLASPEDIWLHVKDAPGSHIIIKTEGKQIPPETLEFAARLAANHSKSKHSNNVPIDYTQRRYVRKPKGAKPGMVIYTHYKTIFIDPKA